MSLNRVILSGKLIKNPELTFTATGVPVCKLTISVMEGGKDEKTGFAKNFLMNFNAWQKNAEYINSTFVKGSFIGLDGRLQRRDWESGGQKHHTYEVVVEKISREGHYDNNPAVDVVMTSTEETTVDDDADPFANPFANE